MNFNPFSAIGLHSTDFHKRLENLERALFPSYFESGSPVVASDDNKLNRESRRRGEEFSYGLVKNINTDIVEEKDSIEIVVEIPGVPRDHIKIYVDEDERKLTIKGTKRIDKDEENKSVITRERSFGHFKRSFHLPNYCKFDEIRSHLSHGVLYIMIPKHPREERNKMTRSIEIEDDEGEISRSICDHKYEVNVEKTEANKHTEA